MTRAAEAIERIRFIGYSRYSLLCVGITALVTLIADVCYINSDSAFLLFGCFVNLIEFNKF